MTSLLFEASGGRALLPGVRHATVRSQALGHRADLSTVLVPGTVPAAMVLLLHGVYGSHWSWLHQGGADLVLHQLTAAGVIPPMLLVMPSDGGWGDGSAYANFGGADHESWIVDEVPDVVSAMHELRGPLPLFIGGLSMGGFGALRLAARHPSTFTAVAAHSSVTSLAGLQQFGRAPLDDSIDDRDLATLLCETNGLPPLALDCGVDDFLVDDNRRLHRALTAGGVAHTYDESAGGHEWPYWQRRLPIALQFFAEHLGSEQTA